MSDIELERTRSIILKPGYAPPEQYTKKSLQGPWTDVYAIAATLYRMVTGIIPEESVNRIIEDNLRAPLEFDPSIPENLSNAIMKGMALRRELRIKDTDEFMSAVFGEKEVMEPNAELRKRRRRRTLTVSTAVLVLICMGIAVYFLYRDKKAETDLNPADITMWLAVSDYEDTEALREMMDSAMADFRENQSRVNVDVEFIKDDEYAERLEEAYSNGEMPTLYDAEYASEEIQDKAADVSRTFEDLSSDSYYLLFENKEKLIEDKVVPLSFRAPVLYVKRSPDVQDIDSLVITDYSQISELSDGQFYISDDSLGMIMSTLDSQDKIKIYKAKYDAKWQSFTGNEIINEFHDDDNMLYYYDTTDVYDTVNKNLVGLYQVVEIDADSIYVEFTNEMSVYGEATRDEENAAVLFLSFLLQPDAQDEMFLGKDSITGLPLAKRTMNQYGKQLGPQETVVLDNGAQVRLGHSDNVFMFSAVWVEDEVVPPPPRSGVIKKRRRNHVARADRDATIFEDFWVDDDEKEISVLGTDRVLNYFTGNGILKNRAVLTNKRLYVNEHHGILSYTYKRYIIELDEITGTGIIKRNPIWSLVMAGIWTILGIVLAAASNMFFLFLICFAIALGQVFTYLKLWGSWFVIYYAGGGIKFGMKNYSLYQTVEFQRAICELKTQERIYAEK